MKQTRRDFVRTLFVASQGIVASRFLPGRLFAETGPAPSAALNFLVFGDWGRQGEPDQAQVAEQMGKVAHDMDAKFVISVGDNFYDNGVASTQDKHWRKSFEEVYTAPSLQVPWYVTLGNHDYRGDCDSQIAYSRLSRRWNMPARYFWLSKKIDASTTADFFFLDTNPMIREYREKDKEGTREKILAQDVPKQLAWFRESLAVSEAQWKIVVGHHPIYSGGDHGDSPELIESILPLLEQYKVQVYFNGHDHDLQHLVAGNVNLIDSGAGSRVRPTKETPHTRFALSSSGFTAVSLQADQMDIRMVDNNGKTVYSTAIPRIPVVVVKDE
ncbi:MAG TPA: tartrate-resistant acid phosphatase type 5 family protein [Desulfuromonadaceae bacterium]|nr:tartrate-resistant acid phosphatase type 5 family protein [Desulfuromonadaceae bacterium]